MSLLVDDYMYKRSLFNFLNLSKMQTKGKLLYAQSNPTWNALPPEVEQVKGIYQFKNRRDSHTNNGRMANDETRRLGRIDLDF